MCLKGEWWKLCTRIPETFKENDGFDFNTGNNSCLTDLTDP